MTTSRLLSATFITGIAAAAIEMVFVLPIQAAMGNSPLIVFQSIASGATGMAAYGGGIGSALQGVGWHVLISLVSALAYILAATRMRFLYVRPLIGGVLCGVVAYVVMNWIVIPLSAIGYHPASKPELVLLSFAIHLIGFGIPIAYVARATARR